MLKKLFKTIAYELWAAPAALSLLVIVVRTCLTLKSRAGARVFVFYEGGFGHFLQAPAFLQALLHDEFYLILFYDRNRHNENIGELFPDRVLLINYRLTNWCVASPFARYCIAKFIVCSTLSKRQCTLFDDFVLNESSHYAHLVSLERYERVRELYKGSPTLAQKYYTFAPLYRPIDLDAFKRKLNSPEELRLMSSLCEAGLSCTVIIRNRGGSDIFTTKRNTLPYMNLLEILVSIAEELRVTFFITGDLTHEALAEINSYTGSTRMITTSTAFKVPVSRYNFICCLLSDCLISPPSGALEYSVALSKKPLLVLNSLPIGLSYPHAVMTFASNSEWPDLKEVDLYREVARFRYNQVYDSSVIEKTNSLPPSIIFESIRLFCRELLDGRSPGVPVPNLKGLENSLMSIFQARFSTGYLNSFRCQSPNDSIVSINISHIDRILKTN